VDDAFVENCNDNDGWYNTINTRWVNVTECTEKEQQEQEYRDYACSGGVCNYSVTTTQWVDTGADRNKPDGTICGYGEWEDDPDDPCKERRAILKCVSGNCTPSDEYEYRDKIIPDLVITEKYETPVDGNFTVTYTVANIGGGDANASNTSIYIDGSNVLEDPVSALAAGENYMNTVGPFDCPCSTTLNVTVCADNNNTVAESNETNNCLSNELECSPCPKPDLVVEKSVTIADGNFTVNYTVTNIGGDAAGASTTCNYVDGVLMENQTCPALGSGESHSGAFDPEPCPCGATINVTVCADCEDVVAESNETNNCEVNIVECPEAETNVTTYDFANLTSAGVDKWAFRYQIDPKSPIEMNDPNIEFVGTDRKGEYTMISNDDHKMQKDSTDNLSYYAAHRFVFNIAESADSIVEIEIQWTGKGVTRDKGQDHGETLYIWNATSTEYEPFGSTISGGRETLTGVITANAENYVDATGILTILVVQNAYQNETLKGRALVSMLSTDYVRADITYYG
jgi:hypothetical protein